MVPIYEQGSGKGIGYGLESFLQRFKEIIENYSQSNNQKNFALIFYDFENKDFLVPTFYEGMHTSVNLVEALNSRRKL